MYMESNEINILAFLDYEKAFDTVEWPFLYQTLKYFNFGPDFISWIQTLYGNATMMIKNNGWLSSKINISRGVRQGCPVSALLFILITEILAIQIKSVDLIQGIKIDDENYVKLCQYADDCTLFVHNENSLANALSLIDQYGKYAGLRLNLDKCEILVLGKQHPHTMEICSIKCRQTVKCLGIHIGHDKKKCEELNWDAKIEEIQNLLNQWKQRNLSIFGKVTVIKSLAIPKILYSAMNTYIEDKYVKIINKILYAFVWRKTERIKRNVLINSKSRGGVGMIDIDSFFLSIKASWMTKIFYTPESAWNKLAKTLMTKCCDQSTMLNMNITDPRCFPPLDKIPAFYKQVILAYSNAKNITPPKTWEDLKENALFANQNVYVLNGRNKKCLYFKELVEVNLKLVKHLKFENGKPCEKYIYSKLRDKRRYFTAISMIKLALVRFKNLIPNHNPVETDETIMETTNPRNLKSKAWYTILIDRKCENPPNNFYKLFMDKNYIYTDQVYNMKIIKIVDSKTAEFNYKILNNTLVCKKYLSKWNKNISENCDLCNVEHNVLHMLFECKYSKVVWQMVERWLCQSIKKEDIFLGFKMNNKAYEFCINNIVSEIAYFLYKYWLLCHKDDIAENMQTFRNYAKRECLSRYKIYSCVSKYNLSKYWKELYEKCNEM